MKTFAGVLIGVGLLFSTSPSWALTPVHYDCPPTTVGAPHGDFLQGGLCQVGLGDVPPGEEYIVDVTLEGPYCFPRIVSQRISGSQRPESHAPFGMYVATAGVSGSVGDTILDDPHGAHVSFYVNNRSELWHEAVLSFIWQCEEALP